MQSLLSKLGRSRRVASRASAAALVAGALISSFSAPAAAQLCVASPSFVPGLSGPPIWTGAGTVRIDLNDPRWGNAPLTPFPQDPNGSQAAYRIVKNGQELSVSIHVITDPALNANDSIYFGYTEGGTVAHLARINLPASAVEPITPTIFHAWDRSAATWTDTGAVQPAWLRDPRAWRRAAAAPANPGDPGWEAVKAGVQWAVNFKVDLPAGALTSDFRVFLAAHVTTAASPIEYHLPDYPSPGTALVPGTTAPDASDSAWHPVTALSTACASGISINSSNIGTTNTPSNKINTDVDFANVFYADPSGIPAPEDGRVLAKFRMAHWGSTIADPQAPWTDLPGASSIPSVSGASHLHTFTCAPAPGGTCPTLGAGEDPHQCVMVELRPAGGALGAGLTFERSMAYRNMDFENLSTLSREAQITVKGLQAVTGKAQDRDVYLYVKESNLPAHGKEQIFLPGERMALARRFAEAPPPRKPRSRDGGEQPKEPLAPAKGAAAPGIKAPKPAAPSAGKPSAPAAPAAQVPSNQESLNAAQAASGPPSPFGAASPHEALVSVFPTYEVHVYYDTGDVVKIDGQDQHVLRPMVPFGYYLSHDGPLYGFVTKFEALNGVVLEELAPNFYHVKIPNEGAIRVKTTVTAEERPSGTTTPPQCPACPPHGRCNCDVPGAPVSDAGWLAAAGALGLVAGLRRGRRRSRS